MKKIILIVLLMMIFMPQLFSRGWNIEGDKGVHFTAFCGAYIFTDWFINELLELDYCIPGTKIDLYKVMPVIGFGIVASASERWGGVYNVKDIYYNLGGLSFGIVVRLL